VYVIDFVRKSRLRDESCDQKHSQHITTTVNLLGPGPTERST
jgi:hypothetical protein